MFDLILAATCRHKVLTKTDLPLHNYHHHDLPCHQNIHGQTNTKMMTKWKLKNMAQVTMTHLPFLGGGVLMKVPRGTDGGTSAPIQVESTLNNWQKIQARHHRIIQRGYRRHTVRETGSQHGNNKTKYMIFLRDRKHGGIAQR
jgi:hypothetical protein